MKPILKHAAAGAMLCALAGLTACGGNWESREMASDGRDPEAAARYAEFTGQNMTSADCVAGGGMTVAGMPASQHQVEVLSGEEAAATEPAAGCPEAGEMPSTQHQDEVLQEGGSDGSSY